jgi:hypothetical protein
MLCLEQCVVGRSGGIEWGAQLLSCLELQYFLQRYQKDGEKVSRDEQQRFASSVAVAREGRMLV